jgi:hypothetical protein
MVTPNPSVGSSDAPPAQEACGRIGNITGEERR